MAITRIGTATATGSTGSGAQSTTVTIPTGATFAVIGFVAYVNDLRTISSVTLDGQTATLIDYQPKELSGPNHTHAFYVSGFSTGSGKTLAWTSSAAWADGIAIGVVFYSGVDLTTPLRDYDSATGGGAANQTITVSLTAQSGDLLAGFGGAENTLCNMNINSQTVVIDSYTGGEAATLDYAEKAEGADDDISINGDNTTLVGFVLIPAAGGGTFTPRATLLGVG